MTAACLPNIRHLLLQFVAKLTQDKQILSGQNQTEYFKIMLIASIFFHRLIFMGELSIRHLPQADWFTPLETDYCKSR